MLCRRGWARRTTSSGCTPTVPLQYPYSTPTVPVQARLGKAYYQLGLYRDAEKQFKSALKSQEMVSVHLELTKAAHAPHTYGRSLAISAA